VPAKNPSGAKRTGLDPGTDTPSGPRHGRPDPIGTGWTVLTAAIGAMAALIALGGMVLSFRAVSVKMIPAFGAQWAWLVPIVVDLSVFVFSGVDLVLARLDMSHPLARWTVYGATGGTVWLNYSAGSDPAGRVAHVLMPAIWVVFVELMRHVVRRQVLLATDNHRESVPAARWLLAPYSTLKLWRRMVLWRVHSYPRALDQERVRLARIAAARVQLGLMWRWRLDGPTRLSIALGERHTPAIELAPALCESDADQSTAPSAPRSAAAPHRAQSSAPLTVKASGTAKVQQYSGNQNALPAPTAQGASSSAQSSGASGAGHSADALEYLSPEETDALRRLTAACAPHIPSQGAIRNALPAGPDGKRCGATRAIRIQKALRERAEHPDAPDPLSDALDSEFAATNP
jgi:hypothetical protein